MLIVHLSIRCSTKFWLIFSLLASVAACTGHRQGATAKVTMFPDDHFSWLPSGLGSPELLLSEADQTLRLTGTVSTLPSGSLPENVSVEVYGLTGRLHILWPVKIGDGSFYYDDGFPDRDRLVPTQKRVKQHLTYSSTTEGEEHLEKRFLLNDKIWLHGPTRYAISRKENLEHSVVTLAPDHLEQLAEILARSHRDQLTFKLPVWWVEGADPQREKYPNGINGKSFPRSPRFHLESTAPLPACSLWDADAVICQITDLRTSSGNSFVSDMKWEPVCSVSDGSFRQLVATEKPRPGYAWINREDLCWCDKKSVRKCRNLLKTSIQCLLEACASTNLVGNPIFWKTQAEDSEETKPNNSASSK